MKKNLFILLLFAFFNVFSQAYTPLLKEGNKWWVSRSEGFCDSCNPSAAFWYIFINGETTVNGTVYKKIYSNLYFFNPITPTGPSQGAPGYYTNYPDAFECLMREDVLTRKVYFLDANSNTEKLIYDFSVNIGDDVDVNWRWFPNTETITINEIVYGSVFGKENVKTFKLDYYKNIYEGIGSRSGLFCPPADLSFELATFKLGCFEDTSGKSCDSEFVPLATSENSTEQNLTLYYSKVNNDFKVLGNPSQEYKITFYESTGRLVEEVSAKGKQSFSVKNVIKNKILFYTITSQGKSWKGKIMIQ